MVNWRDTILKNFKPKISRLTLVADPDGLLTEEGMLAAIKDRCESPGRSWPACRQ